MSTVGPAVREIRIHTALEHRVLYVAKFAEAVYVLHAFEQRSRKTPKRDVELSKLRYRTLLVMHRPRKRPSGGEGEEAD
jgi:phage-related protein